VKDVLYYLTYNILLQHLVAMLRKFLFLLASRFSTTVLASYSARATFCRTLNLLYISVIFEISSKLNSDTIEYVVYFVWFSSQGRAVAQRSDASFDCGGPGSRMGSMWGFVVDKVALGQVFSEYFGFPCQSFHRFIHYHNHPGLTQ
jgi:hypothetical protein